MTKRDWFAVVALACLAFACVNGFLWAMRAYHEQHAWPNLVMMCVDALSAGVFMVLATSDDTDDGALS